MLHVLGFFSRRLFPSGCGRLKVRNQSLLISFQMERPSRYQCHLLICKSVRRKPCDSKNLLHHVAAQSAHPGAHLLSWVSHHQTLLLCVWTWGFLLRRYVCLYDVEDKMLLRRVQISSNRSLDGVLDQLNSKDMTDAGPAQLLADAASDEDELLPPTIAGAVLRSILACCIQPAAPVC